MARDAQVVCEHRLSGECSKEDCAAYKKNSVSYDSCKKTEKGQYYYGYACNKTGNGVKLLDINFFKNYTGKPPNPNFAFMKKKGRFPY